ncbi:MAG TPA: NAD(P)-binding protein [Candidatus Saccharimonadales bacterium]|nr:NAD(P)-binding protein [Candidatus Saccharimonadales bacterium]
MSGIRAPVYDVLIVGAGPAGLATADGLSNSPLSTLVIDSGKSLGGRDQHTPEDFTQGIGGAGLFSDGKFSFFPSSTRLWQLPDDELLKRAYVKVAALLGEYGLSAPPFRLNNIDHRDHTTSAWKLKSYPSFYMSPENRYSLTRRLSTHSGAKFLTLTTLTDCAFNTKTDVFDVRIAQGSKHRSLSAKYVVFAGGRFSPINFPLITDKTFERLEVGFRIEQPHEESFFDSINQLDPKLKLISAAQPEEWRTFCACREGEIIHTTTQGLRTVSGRADCPPTGRSNIGLNVRIKDPKIAQKAWLHIQNTFKSNDCFFDFQLDEILQRNSPAYNQLEQLYGRTLFQNLLRGLELLIEQFPKISSQNTRVLGPTLEGVADYPQQTASLQIPNLPAWVAGDSTGKFRGIVAALVSGYYVAGQIANTNSSPD